MMQFNSYSFLLLLVPGVAMFWILPVSWRRWYVLLVSLLFYSSWNPLFVFVPFGICCATYLCARLIQADSPRESSHMFTGIALVLLTLCFFKYRSFLFMNLSAGAQIFGVSWSVRKASVVLPLGLSFYSFEAISYLVDVRQKRLSRLNFVELCLFIGFWPHLIAGPIVRARELIPQFKFDRSFDPIFILRGIDRIVWGLVQKNVIANSVAAWVDVGFLPKIAQLNTTIDNWTLAVAFGLQIYFDFAAYSNIAIGAAQLLGIRLPENFLFPYHAATPPEFWQKWHMTLSRWVRDYLFFPINVRFSGSSPLLYPSLLFVMAIVGLWHGAGWGFILWGVIHGLSLVAYRAWESLESTRLRSILRSRYSRLMWRGITLTIVIAAWVPFRAGSIHQALTMLNSMFLHLTFGLSLSVNFCLITAMIVVFVALEPLLTKCREWSDRAINRHWAGIAANFLALRPFAYACGLLLFLVFDDRDTQFIYFQF